MAVNLCQRSDKGDAVVLLHLLRHVTNEGAPHHWIDIRVAHHVWSDARIHPSLLPAGLDRVHE